jgi:WD repeat-containing protein 26
MIIGIPTVRASQEHYAFNLQNQTIVATLFAGVIPGMIQVFSGQNEGSLTTAILVLWYTGLIFCISSAVNGLLGLSWMRAI